MRIILNLEPKIKAVAVVRRKGQIVSDTQPPSTQPASTATEKAAVDIEQECAMPTEEDPH